MLRQIGLLYQIEKIVRGKDAAVRLAARREHSAPIIAALKPWLEAQLDTRKNRVCGTDNVNMAGWVRVLGGFGATFDDGVPIMGFSRDSGQTHGVTARFS